MRTILIPTLTETCRANSGADKGPQGQIPPKEVLDGVPWEICVGIATYIDHPHKKEYDACHIDWWFSHMMGYSFEAKHTVLDAFRNAHNNVRIVTLLSKAHILK